MSISFVPSTQPWQMHSLKIRWIMKKEIKLEKGANYKVKITYHQFDELNGKTVIVKFSGQFFKVNWRGHWLILGDNQVEVLGKLKPTGKNYKEDYLI